MFRQDWNVGAAFVNGMGVADCLAVGTALLDVFSQSRLELFRP
jgi:hypothetical protein